MHSLWFIRWDALMQFDELSYKVIGCALEVHRQLGPGLLESAYEACLSFELSSRKIHHQRQVMLPILYKGAMIKNAYIIDFLIDDKLIVELKAVEKLLPVHKKQTLTYMKLKDIKIGLLINFNVESMKEGIKRIVH